MHNVMEYFSTKPDDENEYGEIEAYGHVFYYKIDKNSQKPAKRYSDQFKQPVYKLKDQYKKLNIISKFMEQHDLEKDMEKIRDTIAECVRILHKEYDIEPAAIYKRFNLKTYGFLPEDYGVEQEE
ncbi:hypothetical protein ENBRE01_1841 [Enteropsectra breve]|nr:hypothetical protein ENBRE01_1841 [Enteropsectra breve]